MMHTIAIPVKSQYPALKKKKNGKNGSTNFSGVEHMELQFTDLLNTCLELQGTVHSLQKLIRMLPDCTMSSSASREKVASMLNKIIGMKSESISDQISNILKSFDNKYTQKTSMPEEIKEYSIEEPDEVRKDNALTISMAEEDLKHFNNISYHMGISPSILALIILKQSILKAKDRKNFEEFFLSPEKPSPEAPDLFRREADVLQLMSKGYSNKEIAGNLKISERTVKNHITSLMRKLNVQNRTHAVIVAQQYHLV